MERLNGYTFRVLLGPGYYNRYINQSECCISFFMTIYGIPGLSEPETPLYHYY